jgi:hypothetical protein
MMKRVNTTNVPIQQHAYAIGPDVTNLSCVERKHMNVTPVRHENENLQSHRGGGGQRGMIAEVCESVS